MTSTPCLRELPVELLDLIVSDLPNEDCWNLRLASTALNYKILHTTFRASYRSKTLVLSTQALETFSLITQVSWLSSALRHLQLVVKTVPLSHSTRDLECLRSAFCNLHGHLPGGCLYLLTVKLESWAYWEPVWTCTAELATLIADAIEPSGLKIERFDLYGSSMRCALSLGGLREVARIVNADALEAFRITISENRRGDEQDSSVPSISSLLTSLQSLEKLEVRWYGILGLDRTDERYARSNFLRDLVQLPLLPRLREVALRGIYTTEDTLLAFIAMYPHLQTIILEGIRLRQGSFRSVFEHIDTVIKPKYLYLNDLTSEDMLLQFRHETGQKHFQHQGGPTWMERTSEQEFRPIRYVLGIGPFLGHYALSRWMCRRELMYGPPVQPNVLEKWDPIPQL